MDEDGGTTTTSSHLYGGGDVIDYFDYNWTLHDLFEQQRKQPTVQVALKYLFYAIAMAVALFGNIAIIVVIIRIKSLRTKFNIYIVNLAVADFLMPAFSMWLHLGSSLSDEWEFGREMCKIHTFIQVIVVCASIFTLSVMTVDRFLSTIGSSYIWITQSFQFLIIAFIWIISIGVATPWIVFTVYTEFDWLGGHEKICQANFPSVGARKAYYIIFFTLCYMIPLAVMFSLAISTIIKDNSRSSDASFQNNANSDMRKRAVYLLLTVIVVFCVCWTPQQSLLLWDVYRDRTKKPRGIGELQYTALYMAYSTSAINPVVYFIYNKYYRHAFYRICKTRCRDDGREISIFPHTIEIDRHTTSSRIDEESDVTLETSDPGPSHVTIPMNIIKPLEDDVLSIISSSD